VDVSGEVAVDARVHGVVGYGGGGDDSVAAEVMESVVLRLVEARDWGRHARWKRTAYSPSSLEVDVLDGKVVVRRSRAVVHHLVPSSSSPFIEHYAARRAHTLCPWVKNVIGL
jgi:hypothetical protein